MGGRQNFTLKDKDLLAQYLAKFPANERTKLGTFERAGAQLPGHTAVSWHEHYRKIPANTHDINCRIERILRQQRKASEDKKRRREQEKHGAQNEDGANGDKDATTVEEEDQLASDSEGQVEPVASTSKARSAFPKPKPKPKARTSNGSARRNSPPLSDDGGDESSPDSDVEVQKGRQGKRAAGRAKFTDDDFDLCVRMMADREKRGYNKTVLYSKLEEECPDHTFASWQSWISKNQHDLDEALRQYQDRIRRKREKRRQRRREQEQDEDGSGVDSRRESPVAGPSRLAPRQEQQEERANGNGKAKAKAAAALFAKSIIKPGSPRVAPALDDARHSDDSGSVRPRPSRVDKGKGRALSPRRQRPSPSPSPPRPAAVAAPAVAEEIFTEDDKHILVHQFARGRIKEWETDNICLFLAKQHPQHTQASWSAYWQQNVFELVPLIAARVEVIKQAQAAKRSRAAAAAAEQPGDGRGTTAAAAAAAAAAETEEDAAEGEQAGRRAAAAAAAAAEAKEADERVAREAEERFRREEEEEQEGARAGLEEGRIGQHDDDDDDGIVVGAVDAFVGLPRPKAGPAVDDHLFDAPSPSPSPPHSRNARPSETSAPASSRALAAERRDVALDSAGAATPVKPAGTGAGLAAAVLTPRHTPPAGAEQQPKEPAGAAELDASDGGDADMAAIGDLEPEKPDETALRVAAETVLPSSQSTLPHHSQYSQMPSPFVRELSPAAAADDESESASTTDGFFVERVPKAEEDSDEDLELLVSRADPVKIPIDGDGDGEDENYGAIGEDRQMWNELAPAEHQVIQDLHAAVADIELNLPHGPRRRGGDGGSAPPPVPAQPQPQPQPQPPAQRQQRISVDKASGGNAPMLSQSLAPARPAGFAQANNSAPAQPSAAATVYVLNSPPPPKKRQREHSPTFSLDSDDHAGSQRAPAPKRQKLAPAPAQVGAAKSSARPRHSAPAGLRAVQHDSPVPTPSRRVPRASLAAVTQAASASPAPPPPPAAPQPQPAQNMQRSPDVSAERLPSERSAHAAAAVAQQQEQPAAKTAPVAVSSKNAASESEKPAAAGGLKLKELVAVLARRYGVPQRAITNLIFCTCARCDPETLEDLVRWFAPAHRPLEGTPEYERLAGLVAKHVWTLREDTIALEGNETAVAQLEAKRGKQAIKRRVLFLGRANIKNVASLRKDLYNFRV